MVFARPYKHSINPHPAKSWQHFSTNNTSNRIIPSSIVFLSFIFLIVEKMQSFSLGRYLTAWTWGWTGRTCQQDCAAAGGCSCSGPVCWQVMEASGRQSTHTRTHTHTRAHAHTQMSKLTKIHCAAQLNFNLKYCGKSVLMKLHN